MKLGVLLIGLSLWWGFWAVIYSAIEIAKDPWGGTGRLAGYLIIPALLGFLGARRLSRRKQNAKH